MTVYVTLYLTDNGPSGTTDSAALDGPTNMAPPDCFSAEPDAADPVPTVRSPIVDTPSQAGVMVAARERWASVAAYARTFSFDAARSPGGAVIGRVRDLPSRRASP